jgi:S-formylglutathione hydrolase FrmB
MLILALLAISDVQHLGKATVSDAKADTHGFLVHEVHSSYQSGTTQVRVLLPSPVDLQREYPVVYVLPVEAGNESRYGDGLLEVKQQELHRKLQAVFVAPTFSHLPWYADHPTDPEIRQETYFLQVVAPMVEKNYPVQRGGQGRYLLGFSKSGWGAFSLLLRHPDQFARAAAWDAPLMMEQPGRYGSGENFGPPQNFDAYQVSDLIKTRAELLRGGNRLVLMGYGNFRSQHEQAHAQLTELKIPHDYRDGPARKHDWHSGWVAEAAALLLAPNKDE